MSENTEHRRPMPETDPLERLMRQQGVSAYMGRQILGIREDEAEPSPLFELPEDDDKAA